MTFYCLPAENKLYIHLDSLPSIFLVAYELRNVIWTAVSISRIYIYPPLLSSQAEGAIQPYEYTLEWSAWGDFYMKPVRIEKGERRGREDDAVVEEAFEPSVFGH